MPSAESVVSRDSSSTGPVPAFPSPGLDSLGRRSRSERLRPKAVVSRSAITKEQKLSFENQADAPACHECGSIMVRSGSCYRCTNCGATSGCS
jgi:ribonucleoside-diphosphate reductase alpha chain